MFEYRFEKVNKFLEDLVTVEGYDPNYLRNNCINDVGIGPIFVNLTNEYGLNEMMIRSFCLLSTN